MKKIISIFVCSLIIFSFIGCGSNATQDSSQSDTQNNTENNNVASKVEEKKTLTAEEYANKLKEKGLAIDKLEVYTAENDPNKLLGRPNQYTSKVNFTQGSIEVFSSAEDVKNRKEYIDSIGKKASTVVEYSYINGTVLLRINKDLTPDEAKKYQDEFMKL